MTALSNADYDLLLDASRRLALQLESWKISASDAGQVAAAAARARQATEPEAGSDGTLMGAETTGLGVEVQLRMVQVPTSMVHVLGSRTPLVSYKIDNRRPSTARLKLVTSVVGFSADAIDTVEIASGQSGEIPHMPVFFFDRIAGITEARAACVHVRVEDLDAGGSAVENERTYRTVLLPRTTAYLEVRDGAGGPMELVQYLAAWVTPNAPEIMHLLRDAAELHPEHAIAGYQPLDSPRLPDLVSAQVAAIYQALRARKLTYVQSVIALDLSGKTFTQRIRLPRESLATASINCIDGVVLMASVLEAASLNPAIVVVPGHALLAYELMPDSGQWAYVETTLLGSADFAAARAAGNDVMARLAPQAQLLSVRTLRTERCIFPME